MSKSQLELAQSEETKMTPKSNLSERKTLRAVVEIEGSELRIYPIADSDGDEKTILDAVRFVRDDLHE